MYLRFVNQEEIGACQYAVGNIETNEHDKGCDEGWACDEMAAVLMNLHRPFVFPCYINFDVGQAWALGRCADVMYEDADEATEQPGATMFLKQLSEVILEGV